jgi:hypothetical protein
MKRTNRCAAQKIGAEWAHSRMPAVFQKKFRRVSKEMQSERNDFQRTGTFEHGPHLT